jgi:hypothetical protein
MYYNSFQSSRAATIPYHRKRIAEAMYYNSFQSSRAATILWGRLATGWQPAADWQSACL